MYNSKNSFSRNVCKQVFILSTSHILKKTGGVTGEVEDKVVGSDCVNTCGDWSSEARGGRGDSAAYYATHYIGTGFFGGEEMGGIDDEGYRG